MRLAPYAFAAALAGLSAGAGEAQAPTPPSLRWPIACQLGVNCEIQSYIDADSGPAAKDYTCGTRTYAAHNGIDIRVPDMAAQRQGVAVLAAADGKVLRVRDGVADVSVRAGGPVADDRACGNGLVVGHAGGLETQYCHMAQGSLLVKPGDMVKAGDRLGRVGLSGQTEFPHLHFTVREAGKVVDPFAYGAPAGACRGGKSLWAQTPPYRERAVLNVGFASGPVTMEAIDAGTANAPPTADAPAMVAWARAIGLKAGDVQELVMKGPDGAVAAQNTAQPLPRDQAQNMIFGGRRKPAQGWTKGRWTAVYSVKRDGKVVLTRTFAMTL